jgi:hypothetical protein
MNSQAKVICNGTVISIEEAGRIQNYTYSDAKFMPPCSMIVFRVRVKVLHLLKGQAPSEIEFRYKNMDYTKSAAIMDGPIEIHLRVNERYRFYLKPIEKDGSYVTIFDGRLDDYSIEALTPSEADDSPGLARDEAIKIARNYIKAKEPGTKFDWDQATAASSNMGTRGSGGAVWNVVVSKSPGIHSGYSQIVVRMDGAIDLEDTTLDHP